MKELTFGQKLFIVISFGILLTLVAMIVPFIILLLTSNLALVATVFVLSEVYLMVLLRRTVKETWDMPLGELMESTRND